MAVVAVLLTAGPAGGADRAVIGAAHQEVGWALDDLAREMERLGERWREHFARSERWPERARCRWPPARPVDASVTEMRDAGCRFAQRLL